MNPITLKSSIMIAALATFTIPTYLLAQTQNYVITNLGTQGGSVSAAVSINARGLLSGFSYLPGDQTEVAVVWRDGKATPLGTLGGLNSGVEWPNHNPTAVVGIAETADIDALNEDWSCAHGGAFFPTVDKHICLGFVWQNGTMTPLATLGGNHGYAAGANDVGQVVGWSETSFADPTCVPPQVLQFVATLWQPTLGQVQPLFPLAGDPDSAATAINNKGQVVGISGICEDAVGEQSAAHAVMWEDGVPTSLGNIGGPDAWNTPTAINDRGQVVGFALDQNSNFHAFLWTEEGGMQDLKTLPGDIFSFAYAINDRGQVVGQSIGSNGSRAFIWQNGVMTDLNCLTVPGSLPLVYANDVNNSGRIAGQAKDVSTGETPAFVGIPTQGVNHCSAGPSSASTGSKSPGEVILPQNIRALLQKSGVLSRLGVNQ